MLAARVGLDNRAASCRFHRLKSDRQTVATAMWRRGVRSPGPPVNRSLPAVKCLDRGRRFF